MQLRRKTLALPVWSRLQIFFETYGIFFILLLASALRVFRIDKRDFWYDEAFTGVAIKESFSDMMNMIIKDVHPPLYYILVKIFSSFFDYSVFGIRMFSAIFGVLAVCLVYIIARKLIGFRASIIAAFIAAVSPFAVQYSQEARMYALLGTLILSAFYFFIRGLETSKYSHYFLWGLFLGLSFLTHYISIIFAPVFSLVFVCWKTHDSLYLRLKISLESVWRTVKEFFPSKGFMLGGLTSFLLFVPWLGIFLRHLKVGNLHWTKPAVLGDIFLDIQIFLLGNPKGELSAGVPVPNEIFWTSTATMTAAITILLTLAVYRLLEERKREPLTVLMFSSGSLLMVYLLSQFGKHYFVSRFLLPISYFTFILIAYYVSKLKKRYLFLAIVLYLSLISSIVTLNNSTGYNKLARDAENYKGSTFYVLNSFDYVIAKYYLGADRLVLYNIDWPEYDTSEWAAIGTELRRTENLDDLKNDENGIIIHNEAVDLESRSDKSFSSEGMQTVKEYDNVVLYQY